MVRLNSEIYLQNRDSLVKELTAVFDQHTAEVLADVLFKILAQKGNGYATRHDVARLEKSLDRLSEAQRKTEETLAKLIEAQARTEARLDRVEAAIEKLAEAQARAEARLDRVEAAIERLTEAQARTEEAIKRLFEAQARTDERLNRVEAAIERLSEAQARTEERLDRVEAAIEILSEAQARTEETVKQLGEAQRRTEIALERLAKQVGGLSETVGGDIEDIAYIVIHDVLKREWNWDVDELERTTQFWGGREVEIDVFGKATDPARPGQTIWIVGEAKHNLSQTEVERFTRVVEEARQHLKGEIIPICFCYRARPEVRETIKDAGYYLVFSYGKLVQPERHE